jgi:hypothetical protein
VQHAFTISHIDSFCRFSLAFVLFTFHVSDQESIFSLFLLSHCLLLSRDLAQAETYDDTRWWRGFHPSCKNRVFTSQNLWSLNISFIRFHIRDEIKRNEISIKMNGEKSLYSQKFQILLNIFFFFLFFSFFSLFKEFNIKTKFSPAMKNFLFFSNCSSSCQMNCSHQLKILHGCSHFVLW